MRRGGDFRAAPEKGALWDRTCALILGQKLDLWDILLDNLFVERAKALVTEEFSALRVVQDTQQALQTLADGNIEDKLHSLETIPAAGWNRLVEVNSFSRRLKKQVLEQGGGLPREMAKFSPAAGVVAQNFDAQLHRILAQVVRLRDAASEGAPRVRRASQLEPHTQQQCHLAVLAIAKGLQALLPEGSAPSADRQVERALFVARLALLIGEHSANLAVVLGPAEEWAAADGNARKRAHVGAKDSKYKTLLGRSPSARGGVGAKAKAGAAGEGKLLEEARAAGTAVAAAAYGVWAVAVSVCNTKSHNNIYIMVYYYM
jgi:hypothetical protein